MNQLLSTLTPLASDIFLIVAAAAILLINLVSWRRSRGAFRCYRRYVSVLIILLATAAFLTGYAGFAEKYPQRHLSFVAYHTLQAMLLGGGEENVARNGIVWARTFSILLGLVLAVELITRLFRDSLAALRLNLRRLSPRPHDVVYGLGRIGLRLVQDLRQAGRTVVVVEQNTQHVHLDEAREMGAIILHEDATDDDAPRLARVHQANTVFAVTGSDAANAEIVADTQRYLQSHRPRRGQRVKCCAHITDPDLSRSLQLLSREKMPSPAPLDVQYFNVFENAARSLVCRQLLPFIPRDDQVAHFVVVGFGDMGQSLVKQLAELAHFANGRRARITILHENTEQGRLAVEEFRARHPRFAPEFGPDHDAWRFDPAADDWSSRHYRPAPPARCDEYDAAVEYVANADFAPLPGHVTSETIIAELRRLSEDPCVAPAVFICLPEENDNFTTAAALKNRLITESAALPIFVWIADQRELVNLLHEDPQLPLQQPVLIPFGASEASISLEQITQPLELQLAKSFHRGWSEEVPPNESAADARAAEERLWNETSEINRYSSLSAAAHAHIKLAVSGLRIPRPGDTTHDADDATPAHEVFNLTDSGELRIAKMEHNRWMSERLMTGWRWGPQPPNGDEQANRRKTRHQIVPNECLDAAEMKKDVDQLHELSTRITAIGLRIESIKRPVTPHDESLDVASGQQQPQQTWPPRQKSPLGST